MPLLLLCGTLVACVDVMTIAADPVRSGLVPSLAHPGGNVTGMSALAADMAGKRVELRSDYP